MARNKAVWEAHPPHQRVWRQHDPIEPVESRSPMAAFGTRAPLTEGQHPAVDGAPTPDPRILIDDKSGRNERFHVAGDTRSAAG
ncbi:MAG: hypothetical protein ACPGUC_01700 [Gammaproteobacteria bacterium]